MVMMIDVADVLGLPPSVGGQSAFGLITRIEEGLPLDTLDRVVRLVAPGDAQFKYRLVPKATYERRKTRNALSADQGTRVARLAKVWGIALDVWKDADAARHFLFRPHPMLEDKRPVDVTIQSEFGAEMVVDILGRLKYGSAA